MTIKEALEALRRLGFDTTESVGAFEGGHLHCTDGIIYIKIEKE